MKQLRILLIDDSFIVREGVKTLLSMFGLPYSMEECEKVPSDLVRLLSRTKPNLVMVRPDLLEQFHVLPRNNGDNDRVCYVGLSNESTSPKLMGRFDFMLSLISDKTTLFQTLNTIIKSAGYVGEKSESAGLSERELTILKFVALGHTNNEIGERLFISTHTVMTHRKNITRKLGIKTVSGLTVYAILNNLVKVEELQITEKDNL
jgi:DNA-binding NarL/FixJ family response regulator